MVDAAWGGVADEGDQAVGAGVLLSAAEPIGEEGEQFGELDGVALVEADAPT